MAETKQKAAHTPGPWIVGWTGVDSAFLWLYQSKDDGTPIKTVVDTSALDVYPLSDANARLIVAAPELLEACKLLLSIYTEQVESEYGGTSLLQKLLLKADPARAAIAKAEGGAA